MEELISYREYARRKGVRLYSIQRAISAGRITPILDSNNRPKIDPDLADKQWEDNTNHQNRPHKLAAELQRQVVYEKFHKEVPVSESTREPIATVPKENLSYVEARTLRETYLAKLAQLEYEQKMGKLADASDLRNKIFQAARTTRDALMNIPDRIAGEVAAETDYHKVYDIIKIFVTVQLKLPNFI